LIVAAHGAGGVPEWECEYWRHLSRGRAFLLCLRGAGLSKAEPSGYFYRTHITLGQEFRAAIKAFRERFSSAPRSAALYTGFSQGATMGAQMILEHGREFPYLALLEGGYDYWSRANAQRFGRLGGKRVLFVCGTQYCANKAKIPAAWLREANVEVRIEHALGAGHTPTGEVMTLTLSALPWLTAWEGVWE
jgi:predicted esterase